MTFVTRFAPSPTGPLHLGHAYSAMLAHDMAVAEDGTFLLRIEDIDRQRSRPEWEARIYHDLQWLGLSWPQPALRQSDRLPAYESALDRLWARGLLYDCNCSRGDIFAAASAPQEGAGPTLGPDGVVYPGTCRWRLDEGDLHEPGTAIRLAIDRAAVDEEGFVETGKGPGGETGFIGMPRHDLVTHVGDVVLARRDFGTSYHLSVVLDDAAQGVTHVVRGQDLFGATPIHVVLQRLLGLPTPVYHHHRLIRDETGRRLAKRDDARALSRYRAEGATPADIRRLVGLPEVAIQPIA